MALKREAADYRKILISVLELLNGEVTVREVVTDFERAVLWAFGDECPRVKIFGWAFHFKQAVFWDLKRNGLVGPYRNDDKVRQVFRWAMCLHLLPAANRRLKKCFQPF